MLKFLGICKSDFTMVLLGIILSWLRLFIIMLRLICNLTDEDLISYKPYSSGIRKEDILIDFGKLFK